MKVIVIGLGAMGSSALYNLSKRGIDVIGIDKFSPPHQFGSTHGDTRVFRVAYKEGIDYVPLLIRAKELWYELSQERKRDIFLNTGVLYIANHENNSVTGPLEVTKSYDIDFEQLSHDELVYRYPALRPDQDMVGFFDKEGGILKVEDCVESYLEFSRNYGAKLILNETVLKWKTSNNGIEVITESDRFFADKLIVSAGAWLTELIDLKPINLSIERQVNHWIDLKDKTHFSVSELPVTTWEYGLENRSFYTIPDLGQGFKISRHHGGEVTNPNDVDRNVKNDEIEDIQQLFENFFEATGIVENSKTCLYTNTDSQDFLIDFYRENDNVLILSPCSGHGFKFASVLGEVAADLIETGKSKFNLTNFSFEKHKKFS